MARITDICKAKIIEANVIIDIVTSYQETKERREGKDFKTISHPKLILNTNRATALAYTEGNKGYNCISYLMEFQNRTYPEALLEVARAANIPVEYVETPRQKAPTKTAKKGKPAPNQGNYRDRKLTESGITKETQTATVLRIVNGAELEQQINVYETGTIIDWDFSTIKAGDDMIIRYIDLYGREVMTTARTRQGTPKGKPFPLIRVRYQHPDLHKINDRATKYVSPPKSGTHIYYPEYIRQSFKLGRKISTLYIQEGENKADKATQEGIISIGVMGIHSIASNNSLPAELSALIKKCNIDNIVFIVDGDYQDLGHSKKEAVNRRPNSFFLAIRNFERYFREFNNQDIFLKLYFGYIKSENEKGIDDLLVANPEKVKEIAKDIKATLNIKDGTGKYLDIHEITNIHEFNLRKFFNTHSRDAFFKHHRTELIARQYFTYGKEKFRYNSETEDFELNQPMQTSEMFYAAKKKKDKDGNEATKYSFDPEKMTVFLQNRGFSRYQESAKAPVIHVEKKSGSSIIKEVSVAEIKDFTFDFTREIISIHDVINLLHSVQGKEFGDKGLLSTLNFTNPQFHQNDKVTQYYYFKDNFVKITPQKLEVLEYNQLNGAVWQERISPRSFKLLPQPFKAEKEGKKVNFTINDCALDSEFFSFLYNASNFYHLKGDENLTATEIEEVEAHLLNKLTGFGYLLHNFFNPAVAKLVIALDGKESEIGDSNGRTGKSLIGEALRNILPVEWINGKTYENDNYPWQNVTSRTPVIVLDDPRQNFDLESFFSLIMGNFITEAKGKGKITIASESTPKIYIPTNHGVNVSGSSERARTFFMAFSDYYTDTYGPDKEFGHLFFSEWSDKQFNQFLNTAFYSVQLYLSVGLQAAPSIDIETRAYRAIMTDKVLNWADEYFHNPVSIDPLSDVKEERLGKRLLRKDLFEDYKKVVGQNYAGTSNLFKKRILAFCSYSSYIFNPGVVKKDGKTGLETHQHGGMDKTNGVEYFTIVKPTEV